MTVGSDDDLADGVCESGSMIVLAPVFWRTAETWYVLPQAATDPAEPVTRKSGSEYPSEEYDSNCRPSSRSRAARSVRRRARRLSRARRVSQGNTEHLPAAEGPRSLRAKWESRSDPPTSYTVKTSRDIDTSIRLDRSAVRDSSLRRTGEPWSRFRLRRTAPGWSHFSILEVDRS